MRWAGRFAGILAVVAVTSSTAAESRGQANPDYLRLIDEYARDPEKALASPDLYNLAIADRYVRDVERGRASGFSTKELSLAALLHFEAASRTPVEYGAALVRVHLRGGALLTRRLHERGERDFLGSLFIAAYRPLMNELPLEVLRHLPDAQKLLPDDVRLMLMTGATFENLAFLVRDPNPPKPLSLMHPCSPSTSHCLVDAERLFQRVRQRDARSVEAHLRWANVRQMLGRDDGAGALRDIRAKGVEPYATLATLFLARAAADDRRGRDAQDLYESVSSADAGAYVAALARAALHEQDEAIGSALAALLPALSMPATARDDDPWFRYRTFALEEMPSLRQLRERVVRP